MKNIKYKYNFISYLYIGLSLFFINGCYDDKGNYSLTELNDIEITGIEDYYEVNIGDRFEITPVLEFTHGKEINSLSYEWHKVETNYQGRVNSVALISEDFVLDFVIGGALNTIGNHSMLFRVKDNETGVYYWKTFTINTGKNPLATGFITLAEKPDGFDIDFIASFEDKYTVYTDVIRDIAPDGKKFPREGTPLFIQGITIDRLAPYPADTDPNRAKSGVFISTDQLTARLKFEDFSYLPEYNITSITQTYNVEKWREKYFPNGVIAEKIVTQNINNARAHMYIDGNWFMYNTANYITNYLSHPVNRTYNDETGEFSEPFKVSPYLFVSGTRGAIMFNEDENRFMYQQTNTTNATNMSTLSHYLRVRDIIEDGTEIFSFNNPNYRLVYMGKVEFFNNDINGFAIVFNTATSNYELLVFRQNNSGVPQHVARSIYSQLPDITQAKFFVYKHNTSNAQDNMVPYIYYATEDKLYRLLVNGGEVKDITDKVTGNGYTKISAMKYAYPWGGGSLMIGTYDPNGEIGKNGRLVTYSIANGSGDLIPDTYSYTDENDEPITKTKIFTGIGKIIDVSYKQQ